MNYTSGKNAVFIWLTVTLLAIQACASNASSDRIAFLSKQNDEWHINVIDTNRLEVTRIVTGLISDGCPIWAPDGQRILFVSSNGKGFEHRERNIYVINVDKPDLIQLTHGESGITSASWSPDGSRIVFSAGPNVYPINIFVMNADGTNIAQLTDNIAQDRTPAWSIDRQRILFSSNPSEIRSENLNYDIYLMDTDGSNVTRLTDGPELDYTSNPPADFEPVWSPDGQSIAFHSVTLNDKFEKGANIYIMNADGSNKIQLTNTSAPVQNISPTWSSDGQHIAFASNRNHLDAPGSFDIYVMNADGSNVVRLTSSGSNICPAWRP